MIALPMWLLGHTVTIEPYEGVNVHGDVYGSGFTARALVDDKPRKVLNERAEEVVSSATVFLLPDTTTGPGDRFTLPSGRVSHAITVMYRDGGGLPTPDHIEVAVE